mgnify:CR=1 FL=1
MDLGWSGYNFLGSLVVFCWLQVVDVDGDGPKKHCDMVDD